LTLDGETLRVDLLEYNGQGGIPAVKGIYPTPSWIFFSTDGLVFYPYFDDAGQIVQYSTIAARRSDGALFVTKIRVDPLEGDPLGNVDPQFMPVHAGADADTVWMLSRNELDQNVLYRVAMDGADGPVGLLVDPTLHPELALADAAGDLLVTAGVSSTDPTHFTKIFPADGSAPLDVDGDANTNVAVGDAGGPSQDTFYVVDGNWDVQTGGTIRLVSKNGSAYETTTQTVLLPDGCPLGRLFHLDGGFYTSCGGPAFPYALGLIQVIEDGAVVAEPTVVPVTGVDQVFSLGNWGMVSADGWVVALAASGDQHVFVRLDGVSQEIIPVDNNIDVLGVVLSSSGDFDFVGGDLTTGDKVVGRVEAGATEVTILSTEDITEDVIAFTRIN